MIYMKAHTEDNRETELCTNCRFQKLCNGKNKTYAPMLTACACNIVLLEWASCDVEQTDGKITVKTNALRKSQCLTEARHMLQRLFTADILCDTPHCNDELRTAVKEYLTALYGKEYGATLDKHPNEKPEVDTSLYWPIPKEARADYGEPEVHCNGTLF